MYGSDCCSLNMKSTLTTNAAMLLLIVAILSVAGETFASNPDASGNSGDSNPPLAGNSNPNSEGIPIFVQEPDENYYIVKNQPILITCKAAPAVQINFKCADVWIRPKNHESTELVDPMTGIKYLETSIEVSRDEVETYFGIDGYWCECHAWNSMPDVSKPMSAKSSRGIVQVAYLKKRFEREPLSSRVELQAPVQLQCLPPEGLPIPEVFWLKDGVQIDVDTDIHYIISSEGNLIISQARLTDTGNYTCGSENIAGRRLSESATLSVLVHGGWSTWSPWSDCGIRCGKGWQRRTRTCNNPSPLSGGNACFGDPLQRVQCTSVCPVAGEWSTWSSWSTCSPDCRYHRRRLCDDPAPQNGGRFCVGGDLDTANCTMGMCRDAVLPDYNDAVTDEIPEENITMYIGVVVAVMFFVAVIIVVIFCLRKKVKGQGSPAKFHKDPHTDLLRTVQPDLTQTVVTIQNHHTLDKPNNNHHLYSNGSTITRNGGGTLNGTLRSQGAGSSLLDDDREPIYSNIEPLDNTLNTQKSLLMLEQQQQLMQQQPPPTPIKNPADFHISNNASPISNQSSNIKNSSAGLCGVSDMDIDTTRPNSIYSVEQQLQRQSLISNQLLPSNIDIEALAVATVTPSGGRITLPESGVSVTIPDGAIKKGCSEEIFVAVCRDDKDRPKLNDNQTILGPVILIGPPGLSLKKPVIVSFQHCASIKHGQWLLSLYSSDSPYDEQPIWQRVCILGQETINTPVYMQVDLNKAHVMSEYLQRYVLVGEPHMAGKAIKILRLAAFAPADPSSIDYNVRVYFLEDTQDAFENVLQVEYKLGGRLLDKPKQMFFQYGGGTLCLSIEELGAGWRCKLNASYQEIPFAHIWSGTQNGLHCSFALEHVDRAQQMLHAHIHVFQKAQVNNSQSLQISCNLKEKAVASTTASPAHMVVGTNNSKLQNSTVTSSGAITLEPAISVFRLPHNVKTKLCQVLDPPNSRGNDWRMLAQRLSVDRYINYFATKKSPTEHILDLWEARHREESAITDLMNSLRVMGRMDAAAILEKQFNSWL